MNRVHAFTLPLFVLCAAAAAQNPAPAAGAANAVDDEAVKWLRKEGLEQSQVMEHLSWMCDVHGPRLTGSPGMRRAQQWALTTLMGWGLANVHTEKWGPFGRGWQCRRINVQVIGDNPWPVIAYPKAWSPSLNGRVQADVVWAGSMTPEQLETADLKDKIVLIDPPREVNEPFDGESKRYESEELLALADGRRLENRPQPARAEAARAVAGNLPATFRVGRQQLEILSRNRPLAVADRGSKGTYGTIFVQGASPVSTGRDRVRAQSADADVIPQLTFAVEHYNRMVRVLQKGLPVRVEIELETAFSNEDDLHCYNVLAEIPGSDPQLAEQLVMLGAHFDSWHSGTGTTDNGCGSAVVMEATRLLQKMVQETGRKPRRTIRMALWSGEEQGLLGSRAYAAQHFRGSDNQPLPAFDKLSGYFNLDNGTGRIRGVYQQGNEGVGPIFRAWLRPFHDLGASTLTLDNTGGTDHQAFDGVGLPGFQFIQDPVSYSTRTHHSNMDVWDHAVAEDLRQASTIMASFVWHTAQRDELLPRKPWAPREPGQGRGR